MGLGYVLPGAFRTCFKADNFLEEPGFQAFAFWIQNWFPVSCFQTRIKPCEAHRTPYKTPKHLSWKSGFLLSLTRTQVGLFMLLFWNYPKGPRTQITGFQGPNTINSIVFWPQNPIIWVLGPLGLPSLKQLLVAVAVYTARTSIIHGAQKLG